MQKRFAGELTRLQDRSNLLAKEIGDQADADLAEVSIQISSLMVQYRSCGQDLPDISKLTLLDYL